MSLFKRRRSDEDVQRLRAAARRGSLSDFLAGYRPSDVTDPELGPELLQDALSNSDTAARVGIAARLLDDGADPAWERNETPMVHILLGRQQHDFPAEAALLQRMLDGGADVNRAIPKTGTPLETLAARFKFSDTELAPFYDVFFARPDLDLLQPGLDGRPVLVNLRKWAEGRPDLVARAEAYLTARGIPVPATD